MFSFNPYPFFRERIIEYCLPSSDGPLISCSVKEFVQEVAARSSAPGGGSVSALIAAMVKISAPLFHTNFVFKISTHCYAYT